MPPRRWRIHHPFEGQGTPGTVVDLRAEEAHHVFRVLRLRSGDGVAVFDGAGREWSGALVESARDRVSVRLEQPVVDPVESPLSVVLFQAACRQDRLEWVVQKATELGLVAITVLADPSAGGDARLTPRRLERCRRIALEACKQSGRRVLPRITVREDLPAPDAAESLALLLDPDPGSQPLGSRLAGAPPRSVWLAAGGEGGFDRARVQEWSRSGWLGARLGPRVLRTETAGLVAAAIVMHRWGDLGGLPRPV